MTLGALSTRAAKKDSMMKRTLTGLWFMTVAACAAPLPKPPAGTAGSTQPKVTSTPGEQEAELAPDVVVSGAFAASMPRGLTSFGGAVVDGAFYLVGGYGGEPHNYSAEGQSRDIWKLPLLAGGRWRRAGSLPYGLQGLAVVGYRDEVCRFGGNRVENARGEKTSMVSVSDAACFHTKTGAWRALPSLPTGRSSVDAVIIGGTVYLAGGWQLGDGQKGGTEQSGAWRGDLLRLDLDPKAPRWTSIEAPVETRAASAVAAQGKIYLMGGLTSDKKPSRAVHVFDPTSSTWSRGPDLPTDGFGMAAITEEPSGHVIATTRDGAVLELEGGAWRVLGTLTFPRFFHRLAWRSATELVAIGGITGMQTHGRTKLLEVFPIEKQAAQSSRVELSFPGQAKNRQAAFVHDDFLYVFGGNNSIEQHDFEPTNFVDEGHRLHLPSLTWARVAPYPQKRQSMQVAWVGDKLFALGGFGHNGSAAVSFNEGYWWNPTTEAWIPAPSLPAGRTQFGLTTRQDRIYVFGGLNYDPTRKESAFDHVKTNLSAAADGSFSGSFSDLGSPLPGPRRAFGGVTLGDEYFMVGGMRENFKLVDDCVRYSFTTKQYRPMPCPPKTRLSARLVALDNKIYAVGGNTRGSSGSLEPDRSIEVFDPKTSEWSVLIGDVGFDTHHANVATYRNQILMASSQNTRGVMTLAFIRPLP
jgi:N-acetylneuraminic acid mutarotase